MAEDGTFPGMKDANWNLHICVVMCCVFDGGDSVLMHLSHCGRVHERCLRSMNAEVESLFCFFAQNRVDGKSCSLGSSMGTRWVLSFVFVCSGKNDLNLSKTSRLANIENT